MPQPELQSGESQSCGRLQKERAQEALRRDNTSGCTGVSRVKNGSYQAKMIKPYHVEKILYGKVFLPNR